MANELDELMDRDPLSLSDADLDAIIDFHRKQRSRRASGEKPAKPVSATVDISHIINKKVAESTPTITRRKL
jgi:hypothetical protein